MAITDDTERRPASAEYDRTPPQDIAAEQSVLGGMLLSKDAIADVVEVLRPTDFYRPAHQTVCEAILDLYGRGEPADAITVSAELVRTGQIGRVGGAGYLHTLMSAVPTAANAGYYAQIVAEQAILRRLVEAGTRIVQMGYGAATGAADLLGSVDDVVDRAQAEVYEVTERRTSEDYVAIASLLEPALDEMEKISASGGVGTGIPTGFADLDQITNGLHPGQMITVAGRPGSGKALALDTPLPTPTGWTTMSAVSVGDELLGADGRATRVVAATGVMTDRPCFEVEFSDGSLIVADAEHQWVTSTRAQRRRSPRRSRLAPRVAPAASARVRALACADAADRVVTSKELVSELSDVPEWLVRDVTWATGSVQRVTVRAAGPKRSYGWQTHGYSRRAVICSLADRLTLPPVAEPERTSVVTTAQLATTLHGVDGRKNHAVATTRPLDLPDQKLPIPPYTLGAWLGDGTAASAQITCNDPEILDEIRTEGFDVVGTASIMRYRISLPAQPVTPRTCIVCGAPFTPARPTVRTCGQSCGGKARFMSAPVPAQRCERCDVETLGFTLCKACRAVDGSLQARLRAMGVLNNKHIPALYLRASQSQRRALLAGLLDTDGTVSESGSAVFAVVDRRLAEQTLELIVGLGYRATLRTRSVAGRSVDTSTCYSVSFTPDDVVFRLPRKVARQTGTRRRANNRLRYVVDVRPVASVPVRCVQVDNDEHLYLAGRSMIPTHNSTLAVDFARSAAIKNQQATAIFSLEMGRLEIMMRLFSAESRVLLKNMRSGLLNDEDWTRMARKSGELSEAPLFIDDSPNLSMMEIRAKARRLKQRHDLKMIVIDYLQLMTSGKRVESRQQEVSEFSRAIKLMAKELDVPVIALSQLNRGPEQRTDKKPMLSDLRESGSIEQDSDVVLLVHREDLYERESPRAGEADLIIAKHRNGPTGTVTVAFQGHYSRFVDMGQ